MGQSMPDYKSRFQKILWELFQFDAADLDFGIYRILNFKRDQINKFIQEDIGEIVDQAFTKYRDERMDNIAQLLEEAKQKAIQGLGPDAFLPSGELKEEYEKTPLGRDYQAIKTRNDDADANGEIKLLVFNDLYNFFSRYYDEGDFAPQYRYSIKGHKYAIPYNGEEVKLYWANSEQYYTKTGTLFRDYAFFTDAAKTYKIVLRTVAAREELGSNKATKARFFVLDDEKPLESVGKNALVIRLQYRELTVAEVKRYEVGGGSNTAKQEKINQHVMDAVLAGLDNPNLKGALSIYDNNEKPLFFYQLSRFSAKNSRDFFIHKNLKNFLSEQLDYFIKAEVISIETLERERFLDKHITRAKVVRTIGESIIDFLAQIEDFQKKLWEKKKFVLKTEYVITTDRVPEEFHQEILKNKKQAKEWEAMGFGTVSSKKELKVKNLSVDTKLFREDFKERLLEKLTEKADLDDLIDGLMIKSENWQGLNLLKERYREQVKCIYIDPPYNTDASAILYKNDYKDSSWLSLIYNNLNMARGMLESSGILCVAIDDEEASELHFILSTIFIKELGIVVVRSNPAGRKTKGKFAPAHEYAMFFGKSSEALPMSLDITEKRLSRYPKKDNKGHFAWANFIRSGSNDKREDRPKLYYPILVSKADAIRIPDMRWDDDSSSYILLEEPNEDEDIVYPVVKQGTKAIEKNWQRGHNRVKSELEEYRIRRSSSAEISIDFKTRMDEESLPTTWWDAKEYASANYGAAELKAIFGEKIFDFAKAQTLVKDCVIASGGRLSESVVLDFFPGSGTTAHAVMNLNKDDGGKRKFILIEMANYFDTVMIPRIKKVAYSLNWKEGKPKDSDGNGVFFKYQVLEQYEDTLDNLELKENSEALSLFRNDYLVKYFLDFESRDNASLVNFEHFKNPFSYRLKVNFEEVGEPQEVIVDLPETFNYLIGLKVRKIKVRKNKGRKYLFSLAEKEGRNIAVVWREYDDKWTKTKFKSDKDFIIQEIEGWVPHVVYINGQSALTPKIGSQTADVRFIEPEFRKRMVNAS